VTRLTTKLEEIEKRDNTMVYYLALSIALLRSSKKTKSQQAVGEARLLLEKHLLKVSGFGDVPTKKAMDTAWGILRRRELAKHRAECTTPEMIAGSEDLEWLIELATELDVERSTHVNYVSTIKEARRMAMRRWLRVTGREGRASRLEKARVAVEEILPEYVGSTTRNNLSRMDMETLARKLDVACKYVYVDVRSIPERQLQLLTLTLYKEVLEGFDHERVRSANKLIASEIFARVSLPASE